MLHSRGTGLPSASMEVSSPNMVGNVRSSGSETVTRYAFSCRRDFSLIESVVRRDMPYSAD